MLAEGQYWEDSKVVALTILDYVKTLKLAGDGMNAWVFDIDETLLSNIPYFQHQDFGYVLFHIQSVLLAFIYKCARIWMMMILLFCFNRGNGFDSKTFKAWVLKMKAPALPSSLLLYNSLLARGFKIFLLTGRDESLRNGTVHNLFQAGYKGWAGLILRYNPHTLISFAIY